MVYTTFTNLVTALLQALVGIMKTTGETGHCSPPTPGTEQRSPSAGPGIGSGKYDFTTRAAFVVSGVRRFLIGPGMRVQRVNFIDHQGQLKESEWDRFHMLLI